MGKLDRYKRTAVSFDHWLKNSDPVPSLKRQVEMFNTIADTEYDIRPGQKKIVKIKKVKI